MGQEIPFNHFVGPDFDAFRAQLRDETLLLQQWFEHDAFSRLPAVGGLELEAWLVDEALSPAPRNDAFLARLDDPLVDTELARFNVELNVAPQPLHGGGLRYLHEELHQVWARCNTTAVEMGMHALMIGILPTVTEAELTLANMSRTNRYRALNEQVLRGRLGRPLHIDILGNEHLKLDHRDVMMESAATSLQVHRQVQLERAQAFFNASVIASAPGVAVAANSPYLFGKDLWDETRIALFEQAVEVGGYAGAAFGPVRRVCFGEGYMRESFAEYFHENLDHYPILLPVLSDEDVQRLPHLRLHNGTIWRWNRPLIGFDADGRPHLRIEYRVMAAGPTVIDAAANAAFYYGLVESLASQDIPAELQLPFSQAKDNFYTAARSGMRAHVTWLDKKRVALRALVLDELLPRARHGLALLDIDDADITLYLGIIEARVREKQNGAEWQRRFVRAHGPDMRALTAAYLRRAGTGKPVHEWDV